MFENVFNSFLSLIEFVSIFAFVLSWLYLFRTIFNIVKVYTLKEGKVNFGDNGLLYIGFSISYIIAYISI